MSTNSRSNINSVSVIGLGYVGLPTAAIIADCGLNVYGVDTNQQIVKTINKGNIHIVEPDLDVLVRRAVSSGKLRAIQKPKPSDVFVLAVPTPFKSGYKPDLKYLKLAVKAMAPVLHKGNLVVLESTSPVGTTQKISDWLVEFRSDLKLPTSRSDSNNEEIDIFIAHSPERVLPGRILVELANNDRIIGGLSQRCGEKALDFYNLFIEGKCHLTDANTAELVKLTENAYRDTNIAFANEMSLVCDKLNINVWDMINLANLHPRVNILQPGPGVGGHCIAVDPWFIVDTAPELTKLIQTSREVNDAKPDWVLKQTLKFVKQRSVIACLGLTYKPDIDDLRESPSVKIVKKLADSHKGEILTVEPNISELPAPLASYTNIKLCTSDIAIEKAEIIIVLTDHKEFKQLDQTLLSNKRVIDTRGIWLRNNFQD